MSNTITVYAWVAEDLHKENRVIFETKPSAIAIVKAMAEFEPRAIAVYHAQIQVEFDTDLENPDLVIESNPEFTCRSCKNKTIHEAITLNMDGSNSKTLFCSFCNKF